MLLFHDDPDRVQGVAARFNFWTAHGSHLGQGLLRSEVGPAAAWERRMAYVMGASMFVRREVVEAVGPMAEDYFLYFEELDWARRIRGRFSQGICLDAVVWHKEGGSIGSASRSTPSDTSTYYLSVNLLRFYAKHLPALMPLAVARLFYEAFKFIRGGDWHSPRVVMAGLGDYILGRRRRGPVRIGRRVERAS